MSNLYFNEESDYSEENTGCGESPPGESTPANPPDQISPGGNSPRIHEIEIKRLICVK